MSSVLYCTLFFYEQINGNLVKNSIRLLKNNKESKICMFCCYKIIKITFVVISRLFEL